MKKFTLLAFAVSLFIGCSSVEKYNARLNDPIPSEDLQADVDFIHKKLRQLHPNLYWYISKESLDYKFDSLKQTINQPMTRFAFHHKISPLISSVRQGHMYVYPPVKRFTKKETEMIKKKGLGPLSQFDFEAIDGKFYIIKNKSYDKSIKIGTELLAVNNISPTQLFAEYNNYFTSDGFNTTLKKNFSGTRLSTFYSYELGIQDSVTFNFKYNDSVLSKVIRRQIDTAAIAEKVAKIKLTKVEKRQQKSDFKKLEKKKDTEGYDELTKSFNRNLRFMEADSSIAVMKIKSFMKGYSEDFYEESFRTIKAAKSKTLIIDLRNNGGGRLREIANLYSYLCDTTSFFIDDSEVVSKTSLLRSNYFKGGGPGMKVFKTLFAPYFYISNFVKVHQIDNGKYVYSTDSKAIKPKPDAFKGKVYVLINGGSFSASCILSSNLKGSGRALFVGEETGGTYNGSVAGIMPEVVLPNSDISVRVGMVFIAPYYKTPNDGRGIFPDKEIIPTLNDRITENDPEMNWILADIKTAIATTTAENDQN